MIHILHGDDQKTSRNLLLSQLHQNPNFDILHLDSKSINPDQVNNFLFGPGLFGNDKILCLDNFFSAPKAIIDQLIPLINKSDITTYLWQNKSLTPTQLKNFPAAKVQSFRPDNYLFKCLYSIKPNNIRYTLPLFQKVIDNDYYDLFLYLLKNHLRKNLNSSNLPIYLRLIELDYHNKTGQLTTPKEAALKQIIIDLTS